MPPRPLEKFSRALRRRSQVRVWQQSLEAMTAATEASADVVRISLGSLGELSSSPIQANHTFSTSLARGALETRAVLATRKAIRQSTSKAGAIKAFQELLTTSGETPTPATFKTLSHVLLRHHVEERLGKTAFQKVVMDAIGAASDRWSGLTEEEWSTLVNYTCRTTERWAERGSSFNKLLGFAQEGSDNDIVAQIEFQMRKSGATISAAVLADLMHLDISWSTALHLYTYSRSMHSNVMPPMEMTDRLMGLMTGYRTGHGGSRAWERALSLYENALASGYDTTLTTYTHALDALWRSADTFHRLRSDPSVAHKQFVWESALAVCNDASKAKLLLSGDEGCAFAESVLKAVAASGRWSVAVSLLSNMDLSTSEMSFRSLVPTAESYAFCIAACYTAGHAAHGDALWTVFSDSYSPRSLHSEVLTILLQSMRHVIRMSTRVGAVVEELCVNEKGLERTVVVACLQLLSSRYVVTKEPKWRLVERLLNLYHSSYWPQQQEARRIELQSVFRCCHLIATTEGANGRHLLSQLRSQLVEIFGASSAEVEWLDDTAVYALQTVTSCKEAIRIYEALPVPLRQAKQMLVAALVRCCRDVEQQHNEEFYLLEEDVQEMKRESVSALVQEMTLYAKKVFDAEENFPYDLYAELLLLSAKGAMQKRMAVEAMRCLSMGSAEAIEFRHVSRIAAALSLTELNVESSLIDGHAKLRYTAISNPNGSQKKLPHLGSLFDMSRW
uniref:Uncharacterized protein n=1 Tax=Trypanosoma vivax (strain Y486) TaxID=1055687 RepID=G0U3V1_TRYVY|nr:conserved hypothetical protein, fragment [Trypanosoma vivax Y486]